jgi:hypothetical protein
VLKFIFWSLLAVNAALFAYGRGYLGHFSGNEHEPERLLNQLNADKLAIISAEKANAASVAAAAPAAAEVKPEACVEIASFVLADARRFETVLAPLKLGDRQSRHNLPGSEVSSYMVYMPPQGSKEGAEKKAGELRALGVTTTSSCPTTRRCAGDFAGRLQDGRRGAEPAGRADEAGRAHRARGAAHERQQAAGLPVPRRRSGPEAKLEKIRAGFPNAERAAASNQR